MNQIRATKPLFGLLVAACLLFAACGSSDDTSTSVAGADGDTAAASDADANIDTGTGTDESGESSATAGAGTATAGLTDADRLGSYTLMDEEFGTMVTVTVEGSTRTIVTNALPDHETGEFPNDGNPNEITAQDLTWEFTTEPVYVGGATGVRTSGVAVNGVKFEPGTGETVTCDSGETYRIEALQDVYNLGLDFNNAHVQPTGEYHYHGISALLVDAAESDDDLVHVGFAADGFLMYYSKSAAFESSYELSSDARTGNGCVASGPGDTAVDIDGTTPDGTYTSDWTFTEGAGDLDACNGTTIDGQYAYIVTDAYPFVSRCLNGEVTGEQGGGAPPGGGAGGAAPTPPDLTETAAALGVAVEDLEAALGRPPFDLEAAAGALGVSVEDLEALLPAAPGN